MKEIKKTDLKTDNDLTCLIGFPAEKKKWKRKNYLKTNRSKLLLRLESLAKQHVVSQGEKKYMAQNDHQKIIYTGEITEHKHPEGDAGVEKAKGCIKCRVKVGNISGISQNKNKILSDRERGK